MDSILTVEAFNSQMTLPGAYDDREHWIKGKKALLGALDLSHAAMYLGVDHAAPPEDVGGDSVCADFVVAIAPSTPNTDRCSRSRETHSSRLISMKQPRAGLAGTSKSNGQ